MARETNGANTQISFSTTKAKGLTNATIAGWVFRPTTNSIQGIGFNEAVNERFTFLHFSDNNIYFAICNGGNTSGRFLTTATGWHHLCGVFDGFGANNADRLKIYFDGSLVTSLFTGTIPSSLSASSLMETFRIGRSEINGVWSVGYFAEIALWSQSLNADQAAALGKGATPDKIAPSALLHYLPLVRDINDVSGGAVTTDQSTTVQNHPRVYS